MRATLPAALLAAAFATHPFPLAAETLSVDAAHSHAEFGVHVLWFGKIAGRLDGLQGTLDLDRRQGLATVDVHVAAAAVRMDDRRYADWARGPDFFDAAQHPQIRFVSQPFPLDRLQQGGALAGTLTLRGISRPVRFELLPQSCRLAALDPAQAATVAASAAGINASASAATASTTIPAVAASTAAPATLCRALARGSIERTRFGMTAQRFTIGDRVELGLVLSIPPTP